MIEVFPFINEVGIVAIEHIVFHRLLPFVGRTDRGPVLVEFPTGFVILGEGFRIVIGKAFGQFPAIHGDVLLIQILTVALGSTQRVEFQAVLGVDVIHRPEVVRPGVGPGGIHDAVTGFAHHREAEGVLIVQQAGVQHQGGLNEVPRAQFLLEHPTGLYCRRVGDDVHGAADGGRGQIHRTQSPLNLNGRGGIAHAVPVRPVHPAVFHVVYRYAVDHNGHVALIKAAHVDPGIPGAAALRRGINAGSGVQHHGNILRTQASLNLHLAHVGEGHRSFPFNRPVGNHVDGFGAQRNWSEHHIKGHRLTSAHVYLLLIFLVADVADGDGVLPFGNSFDKEEPFVVGGGAHGRAFHHHIGADQRLLGVGIFNNPSNGATKGYRGTQQPNHENGKEISHSSSCRIVER